ncbi:hypothetical protein D3C80_1903130 [compost metagenome]
MQRFVAYFAQNFQTAVRVSIAQTVFQQIIEKLRQPLRITKYVCFFRQLAGERELFTVEAIP